MSQPDNPKQTLESEDKATNVVSHGTDSTPAASAGVLFFGGCYLPADFEKWGKMPFWWPEEAACLTLGFDPVPVMQATDSQREQRPHCLQPVQFRLELFSRAVTLGVFASQMQPAEAIALLDSRGETVPPELRDVVSKIKPYGKLIGLPESARNLDSVIQSIGKVPDEDEVFPSTKSGMATMIGTLQKLLLAAAYDAYGYLPHRSHTGTAKAFQRALAKVQLSVSEDTILRNLQKASDNHWLGPFD